MFPIKKDNPPREQNEVAAHNKAGISFTPRSLSTRQKNI